MYITDNHRFLQGFVRVKTGEMGEGTGAINARQLKHLYKHTADIATAGARSRRKNKESFSTLGEIMNELPGRTLWRRNLTEEGRRELEDVSPRRTAPPT